MKIDQDIQERFDFEKRDLKKKLKGLGKLSKDRTRDLLARYMAAVEPNFIPWVAAASVSARSVQARYAASENLYEEIEENHQGMLLRFVSSSASIPTYQHYGIVHGPVQRMRTLVSRMNGLTNIAVLAYLENTSEVFIPILADLSRKLGGTDFEYTDKHGVADIEHSRQFLWALGHERKLHDAPHAYIGDAIMDTQRFMWDIFGVE